MSEATALQKVPVTAPIRGLRLHPRRAAGGTPAAAPVQWLLSLGERERQQQAERAAVQAIRGALQRATGELPGLVQTRLEEIAGMAVELGLAVAREIVGQALDRGFVDPTATVVRCLRDCVHGSRRTDLVVRFHPEDLELVKMRLAELPEVQEEAAAARFVADRTVPRGAVRAETDTGRLVYEPREALERVCEAVRREASA